jgi:hypothetical protein
LKGDFESKNFKAAFKKLGSYMHEHSIEAHELPEMYLFMDDCETSLEMIQMHIATIKNGDMSKAAFKADCASHSSFVNYKDDDYGLLSKIFTRCQIILRSKSVSTGSIVGLAGGASAGTAGAATGASKQDINQV